MMASQSDSVASRLIQARSAVGAAARQALRGEQAVSLIAVSKFQPRPAIEAALAAGQRDFGESRVQEVATKWPELQAAYQDVRLHLVGPLQTNKVKQALRLFDVIAVLDRDSLARAVQGALDDARPGLRLLVQVNVGSEPQKSGVEPGDADAFIERCLGSYRLPVTGVMCIPPNARDPAPYFRQLFELAHRHGLAEVSMGMTEDFEIAIACGSTQVRIGRGIFGARPARGDAQ
jgi:PLP dependent protein